MQARSRRFLPCQYSLSFAFYFVESHSHSNLRFFMIQLEFSSCHLFQHSIGRSMIWQSSLLKEGAIRNPSEW